MPLSQFDLETWLRKEVFSSWWQTMIFTLILILALLFLYSSLNFVFNIAQWARVGESLKLLAVYQYPSELLWRPFVAFTLFVFYLSVVAGVSTHKVVRHAFYGFAGFLIAITLVSLYAFVSVRWLWCGVSSSALLGLGAARYFPRKPLKVLMIGGLVAWFCALLLLTGLGQAAENPLRLVHPKDWGGVLLTLVIFVTGLIWSLPLGFFLALGQLSPLPIFRTVCLGFVKLIHALPLVVWFITFHILLAPIFVGVKLEPAFRAQVAIVLLGSAYISVAFKDALCVLPKEQSYASKALGLPRLARLTVVTMPQVVRLAKSKIVFIAAEMYQATSLLLVVGVLDVFAVLVGLQRQGNQVFVTDITPELFLLILLFYFIPSYLLNRVSQRI